MEIKLPQIDLLTQKLDVANQNVTNENKKLDNINQNVTDKMKKINLVYQLIKS